MSTTIRAVCAHCGSVDVPIAAARLALALDDGDGRNTFVFDCPRCGSQTRQRVAERATRLLSAAGITAVAELATPSVRREH